jgi:hypothetical protein
MSPTETRRQRADDARMARAYTECVGVTVASDDLQPTIEHRAAIGANRKSDIATWTRINRRAILAVMQRAR